MAAAVPSSDANRLREEGNELHKRGKLSAAASKYEEAAKMSTGTNALPYSNLSAVLYEMAEYSESIKAANAALDLAHGLDERMRKRLRARIVQAELQPGPVSCGLETCRRRPRPYNGSCLCAYGPPSTGT